MSAIYFPTDEPPLPRPPSASTNPSPTTYTIDLPEDFDEALGDLLDEEE